MRSWLCVTLALLLPACSATLPADGREATALNGAPLFRSTPAPDKLPALEAQLADAQHACDADPSEARTIALGKRLCSLGRYRDAVDTYTRGLQRHPDSHRLLRHRGHRYLTLHQLPRAVADLSRAWELAQRTPDAPESPDGRSTDRSAITYHLGLAHYLNHDFTAAAHTYSQRSSLPNLNDDNLVGALHWHYWSLRRLGRAAEAQALLAPIRNGMDVQENQSYYTLCKLYRGLLPPAQVEGAMTEKDKLNAGLAYGLALWMRYELHDPAGSDALLRRITADDNWTAFGHLAAEADLARR